MTESLLTIEPIPGFTGSAGIVFPPYSAIGVSHELTPVDAGGEPYRDTLHALRHVTRYRKYSLRLSCSITRPPSLGGVWPGLPVRVGCAIELFTAGTPERPAVAGSTRTVQEGLIAYRPVLDMRLIRWNQAFAEWRADMDWEAWLEEI